MKKLKICVISPFRPIRGGIALNSTFLCNDINKYHEIFGITYKKYLPTFKVAKYVHDRSEVIPNFKTYPILDYSNPLSIIKTINAIRHINPDLITFQWVSPAFIYQIIPIAIYAKRAKIKTLMTIHNVIPHEPTFLDFSLLKFVTKFINSFSVHYSKQKIQFIKMFHIPNNRVFVAPLARYNFKKIPKTKARKNLGLKENDTIILFYGMVRKYKGLELLIDAMRYIDLENVQLFVCGVFLKKSLKSFQNQIKKYDLSHKVKIMAGYSESETVSNVYSAADLQVLPYVKFSSQSAAGRIGEAFNLPMIVTPFGGLPSLSHIFKIVEPESQKIADAIKEFIKNGKDKKETFSETEDVAMIYNKIFQKIVSDPN